MFSDLTVCRIRALTTTSFSGVGIRVAVRTLEKLTMIHILSQTALPLYGLDCANEYYGQSRSCNNFLL